MFSEGIKRDQWHEMGQSMRISNNICYAEF